MGENTGRARALTVAKNVLTRDLVRPRMEALTALAKAADAAADPDQVRRHARQAADKLIDDARRQGEELLASAKQRARDLRKDARRQAKELVEQAEVDVSGLTSRWRAAYQATLNAGWTVEQLKEAGQPEPPAARRGRRPRSQRPPAGPAAHAGPAGPASDARTPVAEPPDQAT